MKMKKKMVIVKKMTPKLAPTPPFIGVRRRWVTRSIRG